MNFDLQQNVSLKRFNTFGVEAHARHFVRVDSVVQLEALRVHPLWDAGPRLILGGGSNLLLAQDFDGLVVQIAIAGRSLVREDASAWIIQAGAGENWDRFVRWTLASGWPGLENLALIPGTVGAAPIQNIGAYGVELKDRFEALEGFEVETGQIVTLNKQQCRFAYRDSIFKGDLKGRVVITGVHFHLPRNWQAALDYGDIRSELVQRHLTQPSAQDVADIVTAIRRAKLPDPAVIGNAGSFFKNVLVSEEQHAVLKAQHPELVSYPQADGGFKLAAGWLIDQCGWKGCSLDGRAAVHDKQALVLVNRGGATGADILALAHAVQDSVRQQFGVVLEPEPVIV